MKAVVLILSFLMVVLVSCSKKEETKLTAFSSEAFAYDLGDSSEVDATTQVKGFQQKEENNNYFATISYDIDLVTPKGDTLKSLISKIVDRTQKEKISDTELNAQFDLESIYVNGSYKVIFRIKDVLSGKSTVATAGFKLGD